MKEAFGATLSFELIMVFILVFVGIMGIGMNYATSFRVKNQIVDILEKYETYDKAKDYIESYVSQEKYYGGGKRPDTTSNSDCINSALNYCIKEAKFEDEGYYYIVTTYVVFDFPIIGRILQSPVTGQTPVLKDFENIPSL